MEQVKELPKKLKKVKVSDIKPYERNNKQHTQKGVETLYKNISQVGFGHPIEVDENNVILAGHRRWLMLKEAGNKQISVLEVTGFESEEAKNLYRIQDNITAAQSDYDIDNLSIELAELEDHFDLKDLDLYLPEFGISFEEEPDTSEDEIPEEPKEVFTKLGDVWKCGKHTVVCGACDEVEIPEYDMLFADPPYGVSYAGKNEFLNKYDKGSHIQDEIIDDHKTPEEMKELWTKWFSAIRRGAKPGASYYITGPGGVLLLPLLLSLKESKFILKHMLIWVKNNHVLGRCDYHYKHEPILYGWVKGSHKFYGGTSKFSVWNIDKPHAAKLHPTMKPLELVAECLSNSTKKGEIVCDPFLGSGTTLIACERLNRTCYGIEIEPKYVDVNLQRFYNESGIIPIRESDGKEFPVASSGI